ncbi:MAG: nucleotidyltransferase family protein [Acidimicrobiales bacterium]
MTVDDLARLAAGHGLSDEEPQASRIAADQVGQLLQRARTHQLVGLLDQAVAEQTLRCDGDDARRIGDRAVEVAGWCVRLERHLLAVHDLFDAHDLPHRFVKGPSVAHRFYPHPGLRTFVDIDVLVPSDRLDDAEGALLGAGHQRNQPDPHPGFSRRYAKSVTLRAGDGVEVDVHRVLADGPFGLRTRPEVVWDRPAADFALGGRAVPTLDPVAALVHACVNAVASYDRVTLASLRDVAQIAQVVADRASQVVELATAMEVGACVAEAFDLASRELPWSPPASLSGVTALPISVRERQWLDSYRRRPSDLRRTLLGMQALPRLAPKARYLGSAAILLAGRPARRRARTGGRANRRAR